MVEPYKYFLGIVNDDAGTFMFVSSLADGFR
jgi:hypothetical protein